MTRLTLSIAWLLLSAATARADGPTIGFVTVNEINPTVASVDNGFRAEADRLGARAKVVQVDLADAVNSGISAFDQLIAAKVDAIAFWPLDDKAMQAPIARARAAGIPVFAHDLYQDPQNALVSSVIEGRSLKAAQAARLVCARAPHGGGSILYGDFFLPAPTLVFLRETFKAALAKCSPAISVAAVFQNTTDTVEGARGNAESALLAHRDVFAIDDYNDPTAIGASIAANDLGLRKHLTILGYNLAPDGLAALKAGRIDVSWDYRGPEVGQALARVMVDYVTGHDKAPPKYVVVWPKAYVKASVAGFEPVDGRVARIRAGVDLLAADPAYVSRGASIADPPAGLPLPEVK